MYKIKHYSPREMKLAVDRVVEDISTEMKQEVFFHYQREMSTALQRIVIDWESILTKFPSSAREIETGTDCYALGDYFGCVFHMMRIAELGLRAIAKERGVKGLAAKRGAIKPIEWGTWQEVFDAIEQQLTTVRRASPGSKRDVALAFYETALSDLRAMRDLYRDPTTHFREAYDKGQAASAMFRTKELMQTLAVKLREDRVRPIKWGL